MNIFISRIFCLIFIIWLTRWQKIINTSIIKWVVPRERPILVLILASPFIIHVTFSGNFLVFIFFSFHVLKVNIRIVFVDWRDGAEVRSAYYSCRGHQFCSQHHTGVLQSPVALAPEEPPLDLYSQIYISTHKYIYTQLKRKFKKIAVTKDSYETAKSNGNIQWIVVICHLLWLWESILGTERWVSSEELLLCLQRTRVQFQASMPGS